MKGLLPQRLVESKDRDNKRRQQEIGPNGREPRCARRHLEPRDDGRFLRPTSRDGTKAPSSDGRYVEHRSLQ